MYRLGHQHRSGEIRYWSEKEYTKEEVIKECEKYNAVEKGELIHPNSIGIQSRKPNQDSGWRWIYRHVNDIK